MEFLQRLESKNISLRAIQLNHAASIRQLAGDHDIAKFTICIPHPYEEGLAEQWIETHESDFRTGKAVHYGVFLNSDSNLAGSISLMLTPAHKRGELGYWIGKPYWGNGYATEAAKLLIDYGFRELGLNKIDAHHMADNPASGRVLKKAGMIQEAVIRQHIYKWGEFKDIVLYGILKSEHGL